MKQVKRVFLCLVITGLAFGGSGCAAIKEALTASQGNASYTIKCPVVKDDGSIATLPNGTVAMAEFTVTSGRSLGGGANVVIEGCLEVETPQLTQGEDRSPGLIGGAGDVIRTLLALIGM